MGGRGGGSLLVGLLLLLAPLLAAAWDRPSINAAKSAANADRLDPAAASALLAIFKPLSRTLGALSAEAGGGAGAGRRLDRAAFGELLAGGGADLPQPLCAPSDASLALRPT